MREEVVEGIREGRQTVFQGRLTPKGEFVIIDESRKKAIVTLKCLDDLSEAIGMWHPIRECLSYHKANGDLEKWFDKMGESEFKKFIAPFRSSHIGEYGMAIDIYLANRKLSKPNFSMVVGYDPIKVHLLERVVYPHKFSKMAKAYGRKNAGSALLYGPPGCGKTYSACALAGETERMFWRASLSDIVGPGFSTHFDVWKKVGRMVVLIDEIEVLAVNREIEGMSTRMLTNQLLTQLDTLDEKNGLFLLGSTNTPWLLDTAMIRSGRLDKLIYVGVPDLNTRIGLLKYYSKDLPLGKVDFEEIARKTEFYSCSDIELVCSDASAAPFQRATVTGKVEKVEQEDFENALLRCPSTALAWFESASNAPMSSSMKVRFASMIADIERYRQWSNGAGQGHFR
jgi:SpoVK/Ycf46/Vps4 family AAA+-type ATPase